jgi:hypothetical protein
VFDDLKVKYAETIEDSWEDVKTAFFKANDSFKEGFSMISQIWKKEKDIQS